MNALNAQVQEEIRAAATEAAERDDVRAVVVYGGEQVFAAGADIKEMADMSYTDMVQRSGKLQSAFSAVARIPKPVVAAVTGYALGGGCELALCADVRFAADNAVLGQPEILLGIIPGAGGTQRLTRLVGPSKAKDLIFTGRFVKADEALAIGLVDRVVPGRAGLRRGGGLGEAVRRRRDVRPARGQGEHRPRPRGRPRDRPGDRAAAVRGAVRDRGPRASAWSRSWRTARGRPGSWAADSTPYDPRHGAPQGRQDRADRDREDSVRRHHAKIRVRIAQVVWLVFVVCALFLAVGALLIALDANQDNPLVEFVLDGANAVDLGIFSRTNGIKEFTGDNAEVKNALFNWGIGAVAYLSSAGSWTASSGRDPRHGAAVRCERSHRG